jgi:iron(III) transport system permease protein
VQQPPWARPGSLSLLALATGVLVAMPIVAVLISLLRPATDVWRHLWRTQLPELILNTVLLVAGVGASTLVVGTVLAWLVVTFRFPGRTVMEWAFILPLAMPAYVIGFAVLGLLDVTGPVQGALRRWLGEGARLPELRSYGGVVLVMTLVFYPYVYLLARAAFREQGTAAVETARSLGHSRLGAFVHVTLPMARPSLVAGMSLAMMEALADFGTVAIFGYRTLTEAIYRVWFGMFERGAASQLASLLLLLALGLLAIERASRGQARFSQHARPRPAPAFISLTGWRAAAASLGSLAFIGLAFLLPVAQLGLWAFEALREGRVAVSLARLATNTMGLAALTSACTCALAVALVYAARLTPSVLVRGAGRLASMGYALPGSVIAVGILLWIAAIDHALAPLIDWLLGRQTAMLLTGSAVGLVYAYLVRFFALGVQTVEASLIKIPPNVDAAARSLRATVGRMLRRVHLPLMQNGLIAALVLVFVETMKEMPATLLLRPLGLDTLAVEVWERTSESMWQEAAVPALGIVVVGLVPVVLAMHGGWRRQR